MHVPVPISSLWQHPAHRRLPPDPTGGGHGKAQAGRRQAGTYVPGLHTWRHCPGELLWGAVICGSYCTGNDTAKAAKHAVETMTMHSLTSNNVVPAAQLAHMAYIA